MSYTLEELDAMTTDALAEELRWWLAEKAKPADDPARIPDAQIDAAVALTASRYPTAAQREHPDATVSDAASGYALVTVEDGIADVVYESRVRVEQFDFDREGEHPDDTLEFVESVVGEAERVQHHHRKAAAHLVERAADLVRQFRPDERAWAHPDITDDETVDAVLGRLDRAAEQLGVETDAPPAVT